ncbi:MAG: cation acetate symporter, partial [Bacteroidota bacterium]|nr:cation acetate symporter [Bacteroidota bacterium]
MIYEVSNLAIIIFLSIVGLVLGLSFYFARKTKSAAGYYAAGGNIHWGVNGVAFAGDYLSAASFLGICGMIAYSGYDGFLYSIGYLAGWVVALFLVAEPMKRLGKYTFTDALDAKFDSKSIKLTAAISTLIVSIFYLIPQMVGAGDLVVPLLGLPHWMGVVIVGSIVILIVATAGMTSTTYVQFIKGALLVVFSTILTFYILNNGLTLTPNENYHKFITTEAVVTNDTIVGVSDPSFLVKTTKVVDKMVFVKLEKEGSTCWYKLNKNESKATLEEMLYTSETTDGTKLYNGAPKSDGKFYQVGHLSKIIVDGKEVDQTGTVGPFEFLTTIENSEIVRFSKKVFKDGEEKVTVWYQNVTKGEDVMKPGLLYKLSKAAGATIWD